MEIDVVHHPAVFGVLEADLHGIADADPHHGSRHLAVEGPVAVARAIGQLAHQLDGLQIDLNGFGLPPAYGRGQVRWRADDADGLGFFRRAGCVTDRQGACGEGK